LILLAQNFEGYQNLVRLTSKAYTEGFYYKPRIDKELLAEHSKGLIASRRACPACLRQCWPRRKCDEAAKAAIEFEEIWERELLPRDSGTRSRRAKRIRKPLVELSKRTGVPLVATNDAHYLMPDDARAHDVLLCIGSARQSTTRIGCAMHSPNFYVRSPEEMWRIFGDDCRKR
jgi:DNA polymerase-3 subunit alpha